MSVRGRAGMFPAVGNWPHRALSTDIWADEGWIPPSKYVTTWSNVQTMVDKRSRLQACSEGTHFFHVQSGYLQARILNLLFSPFSLFLLLVSTCCCLSRPLFWLNSERHKKSKIKRSSCPFMGISHWLLCDRLGELSLLFLCNKWWSRTPLMLQSFLEGINVTLYDILQGQRQHRNIWREKCLTWNNFLLQLLAVPEFSRAFSPSHELHSSAGYPSVLLYSPGHPAKTNRNKELNHSEVQMQAHQPMALILQLKKSVHKALQGQAGNTSSDIKLWQE